MFKWLKDFILDMKISRDFPSYNEACKGEHQALAERRFSTEEFNAELNLLMRPILTEKQQFDIPINELYSVVATIKTGIAGSREKLVLFKRNYKEELDFRYAERDTLFKERDRLFPAKDKLDEELKVVYMEKSGAHKEKGEAFQGVNDAQSDIDSWYSDSERSTWMLGNKGKKLPNHSLFGQSHGDLSGYKSDRDDAYHEVQNIKDRILIFNKQIQTLKDKKGVINNNIRTINKRAHDLKLQIEKIKEDRQRMFDLRKQRYSKGKLEEEISRNEKELNKKECEWRELRKQCDEFMLKSRKKSGVIELEEKIKRTLIEKNQFIKGFEEEKAIKLRKHEHREAWIAERCKPRV